MNGSFYVYLYADPETDVPVYVGKGRGKRAWLHGKASHNVGLRKFLISYRERGVTVEPKILFRTAFENEALAYEALLIAQFGRISENTGSLFNVDAGNYDGSIRATAVVRRMSEMRSDPAYVASVIETLNDIAVGAPPKPVKVESINEEASAFLKANRGVVVKKVKLLKHPLPRKRGRRKRLGKRTRTPAVTV